MNREAAKMSQFLAYNFFKTTDNMFLEKYIWEIFNEEIKKL